MKIEIVFKAANPKMQIVYGEIYPPNVLDAHNDFMTPEEIMKMAHKFMREMRTKSIDTNHDNKVNGSALVESFIAREDDSIFIPGSWVGGVHIPDKDLWDKVESGEINGFSLEAMVNSREAYVELEVPDFITGETERDNTGHVHTFEVTLDEMGKVKSGRTDIVDGHFHNISTATVTGPANGQEGGHTHRFSIVEELARVQ